MEENLNTERKIGIMTNDKKRYKIQNKNRKSHYGSGYIYKF